MKAAIHNVGKDKVRAGYSANAEIVLATAKKVVAIPESAIEFSGDSTFVHLVKKAGKETEYERVQVVTGLSDGVNIEVKSGIKANTKLRGPQVVNP